MSLHVHFPQDYQSEWPVKLQSFLGQKITMTTGEDTPDSAQILVTGSPTTAQLRSPNLKALIIPWAGLSTRTREVMANFPHISVHNQHSNALPVAETAVMLMMTAAKHTIRYDQNLRQHDWTLRYEPPIEPMLLHGSTVLVLGYGAIGRHTAKMCIGLGMRVIAIRRQLSTPAVEDGVSVYPPKTLHDLLPQADALLITLPGTPETTGMIGEGEFQMMKNTAVLVNISRGPVVDESALYHALKRGDIAAAGIDVWYRYPADEASRTNTPPSEFPFHELPNVVMSPHRAGSSHLTEQMNMEQLASLLKNAADGKEIPNKVDLASGY